MGNETIKLQDVMGSPMEMLKPMLSEVRWLFGTVYGWALVSTAIVVFLFNTFIFK